MKPFDYFKLLVIIAAPVLAGLSCFYQIPFWICSPINFLGVWWIIDFWNTRFGKISFKEIWKSLIHLAIVITVALAIPSSFVRQSLIVLIVCYLPIPHAFNLFRKKLENDDKAY